MFAEQPLLLQGLLNSLTTTEVSAMLALDLALTFRSSHDKADKESDGRIGGHETEGEVEEESSEE